MRTWVNKELSPMEKRSDGHIFEERVERLLAKLRDDGIIQAFQRHIPYSVEDREGKDFTVILIGGRKVSFGVSLSRRHAKESSKKHGDIQVFHLTSNQGDQEIMEMLSYFFRTGTWYNFPPRKTNLFMETHGAMRSSTLDT